MSKAAKKRGGVRYAQAAAVFLAYHDTGEAGRAFAKAKLESGTAPLTPEAILFMQGAISERISAKAAAEAAEKAEKAEKAAVPSERG